ncbi:hypothetical protein RFI_38102, partial [Reticulomyxa filosa]
MPISKSQPTTPRIIEPSFAIPSEKAYTNGMNETEYEIQAYIAKYQYQLVTKQNLVRLLRKTIDVCTTTLVEESTNNYVPDVIVREIVSFIGNQNIRFVDMNAMKYMRHSPRHDEDAWWSVEMLVSQWKSGPTESHSHHPHPHSHSHRDKRSERRSDSKKQNMGQSILRNEKNLTKMYSHKKSNRRKLLLHNAEDFFSIKKKYKEAYGNNNESAHLFPTWKKLNRNGEHDSLWYDCSQLVQINGICVLLVCAWRMTLTLTKVNTVDCSFNTWMDGH